MNVVFTGLNMQRDWPFIRENLGLKATEDTTAIIAADVDKQQIVGACVFQNWTHTSALVHLWIANPMIMRHGFLQEIGDYFFNTAGRKIMIAMVPSTIDDALKLNAHIGFKETYRIVDGFKEDVDWVVMEARLHDVKKYMPKLEVAA